MLNMSCFSANFNLSNLLLGLSSTRAELLDFLRAHQALRGKPCKNIHLNEELEQKVSELTAKCNELKKIEQTIRYISEKTAKESGELFFSSIVREISFVTGFRYVFIGKLKTPESIKTVAFWANGEAVNNAEYDLAYTPCENVVDKNVCFYPEKIQRLFPKDIMLVDMSAESYLGVPLIGSGGNTIGILVALDDKPMMEFEYARSIITYFAVRVQIEMERLESEKQAQMFASLVKQASEGIAVSDLNGYLTFANDTWARIHGYLEADKLVGKHLKIFHSEAQMQKYVNPFIEKLTQLGSHSGEIASKHKNGTQFPTYINAILLKDDNNNPVSFVAFINDISEKKKAESILKESEKRYRTLFEAASDAIFILEVTDKEVIVQQCNNSTLEIFGCARDEIIGKAPQEFSPVTQPDGRLSSERALQVSNAAMSGVPQRFEWTHKRLDGSNFPAEVSLNHIEIGNKHFMQAFVRDITERKKAETAQLEHLRYYEGMERVHEAIKTTTDLDQMMSNVLKTVLSIFECDRAWLLSPCDPNAPSWRVCMEQTRAGWPGALVVDEEIPMTSDVADVFKLALEIEGPVVYDQQAGRSLPDAAKRFSVQSQMLMAIDFKIGQSWLFGLHQCAYTRIWTQNEKRLFQEIGHRLTDGLSSLLFLRDMQESEEKYRLLFENAGVLISVFNRDGILLLINKSQAKNLGGEPCDFIGKTFHELNLKDADKFLRRTREVIDTGKVMEYEDLIDFPTGDIWLFSIAHPVKNAKGETYATQFFSHDISERVRMEKDLLQTKEQAEKASKAKSIFLANMSHEIRNPMNVILGFTKILQQNKSLPDSAVRSIGKIETSCIYLLKLINDLLDMSKIEAEQTELSYEKSDLLKTMEFVSDMVTAKCEEKGLVLDINVSDKIAATYYADEGKLKQVLINLLDNAIKYTKTGKVSMKISKENFLKISKSDNLSCNLYDNFLFEVIDTGQGIIQEVINSIFEPFNQGDQVRQAVGSGVGLGLSICKNHIELMGGELKVDSEVNKGTRFYFSLSLQVAKPEIQP